MLMLSDLPHERRLAIRLLGPLVIEDGERTLGPRDLGGMRPKQVLEILLMARGHHVPTDRLAELLWAGERPQDAAGSLQTFVSTLRRRLVPDRERARELIVTETEAYRVATALVDLDLDRFDELVERSSGVPTREARPLLEEALALVRGEALEDEPYALWAQDLRGTYQARVLGARLDAAEAALAELDHAAALAHAEVAVALDRFSERAHRLAMLTLYALGRQHDALDAYRSFRSRLDQELGLAPTAETRALESAILRQEDVPSLLPRPLARPRTAAAAASSSLRLLGRTSELDLLEQATRRALDGSFALLLVEGEAGVGKTRLMEELATALGGSRIGRASCSPLERRLPYVPIAAAVRDALDASELTAGNRPALGKILPELSTAASNASGELEALEALAGLVAEHAPVLLLVDDLHWADQPTFAAISYLQRRCADGGVALVATARSEETPPDHCIRRLSPDMVLRLDPLTPSDLAPLEIPDLHDSTGGNPRFILEAITNTAQANLAETLADALLAQCRAEGPWAYRVLVAASVFEQPFEPEPLAALLAVEVSELIEG
ncbi:MAG TPA: BTAD domain-containing putative transcriptional regulator, partial [Gaiellaceae bacterium]|nr:BTAD domain-containing putative transcriptional regulator [Gaiellaceae bacterium]